LNGSLSRLISTGVPDLFKIKYFLGREVEVLFSRVLIQKEKKKKTTEHILGE
jgi:hypothetical protein